MDPQVLLLTIFWSFFPGAATNFILKILYSIKVLKYSPQSAKTHGTIIFTLIIASYFSFSVIKSFADLQPTYYSVLDVSTNFKSKELKVNYKSLSLQYHPDKNGHVSQNLKDQYEEKYLLIRKAYEVLSNKNTLFAYEKFSEAMMDCNTCKSKQDYMYHGLINSITYYGFSSFVLIIMNYFYGSAGSNYWKYYFLFTQTVFELFMVIVGVDFANHLSTGQKVALLRSIGVSGYTAINSLSSVWSPGEKKVSEAVSELGNMCNVTTAELIQWYKWIHGPFKSDLLQEELAQKKKDFQLKLSLDDQKSKILKKNE
jgi:curved DNA-binding protein CbpA